MTPGRCALLALAALAAAAPTVGALPQLLPSDVAQDSGYMPFGGEGARLFYLLQERDGGAK